MTEITPEARPSNGAAFGLPDPTDDPSKAFVFERDGVNYYMDAAPNVGLTMKYLRVKATEGADIATYVLLIDALGPEAYAALESYPNLTGADLEKLTRRVLQVNAGSGESGALLPKAPSN